MRISFFLLLPLFAGIPFLSQQVPSSKGHAGSAQCTTCFKSGSGHYVDLGAGFSYALPSNFRVLNSKQFVHAAKELAHRLETTKQEAKSIDCSQQLLVAENSDESKIVFFGAAPDSCVGVEVNAENIVYVGRSAVASLAKRFNLTGPEYGTFSSGGHIFWAMRSTMVPDPPRNPNTEIAFVVMPVPGGVVQYMLLGRTRKDLNDLMATRIKFEDGTTTKLVPEGVFAPGRHLN